MNMWGLKCIFIDESTGKLLLNGIDCPFWVGGPFEFIHGCHVELPEIAWALCNSDLLMLTEQQSRVLDDKIKIIASDGEANSPVGITVYALCKITSSMVQRSYREHTVENVFDSFPKRYFLRKHMEEFKRLYNNLLGITEPVDNKTKGEKMSKLQPGILWRVRCAFVTEGKGKLLLDSDGTMVLTEDRKLGASSVSTGLIAELLQETYETRGVIERMSHKSLAKQLHIFSSEFTGECGLTIYVLCVIPDSTVIMPDRRFNIPSGLAHRLFSFDDLANQFTGERRQDFSKLYNELKARYHWETVKNEGRETVTAQEVESTLISRVLVETYSDGNVSFTQLPLNDEANVTDEVASTSEEVEKATYELNELPDDLRAVILDAWLCNPKVSNVDFLHAMEVVMTVDEVKSKLGMSHEDVSTALRSFMYFHRVLVDKLIGLHNDHDKSTVSTQSSKDYLISYMQYKLYGYLELKLRWEEAITKFMGGEEIILTLNGTPLVKRG